MANGLFLVSRELFNHPVVGLHKPVWFAAWVWMLGEARWKDSKINIAGDTVILKRGQLSCSYRFMSERLGMSIKGIRVFLARLEKDTMIGIDKGTGQTIITICNYEDYQDFEKYRAQLGARVGAQEGHSKGTARAQTRTPDLTPDETPEVKEEPKGSKKKRGARLPDDWMPNEDCTNYATERGLDLERTTADFTEYFQNGRGRNETRPEWGRSWKAWCRKAVDFRDQKNGGNGSGGNGSDGGGIVASARRVAAEFENGLHRDPDIRY